MTTKPKAVVIYSGGMDSYTVLHLAVHQGYDVYALSFDYGQRHSKELLVAQQVCESASIDHKVVNITTINQLLKGSSLTAMDIAVPTGDYAEDNMRSTVVPNRNMILLSLAIGYAVSLKADKVFYGAHSGDHVIYPDCRPEFVEAMNDVANIANYEAIEVVSPFLYASKTDILQAGLDLGLDYSQTWTCYQGLAEACGQCGSCIERVGAFTALGLQDPLPYQSH